MDAKKATKCHRDRIREPRQPWNYRIELLVQPPSKNGAYVWKTRPKSQRDHHHGVIDGLILPLLTARSIHLLEWLFTQIKITDNHWHLWSYQRRLQANIIYGVLYLEWVDEHMAQSRTYPVEVSYGKDSHHTKSSAGLTTVPSLPRPDWWPGP